jgi:hypothetical protein
MLNFYPPFFMLCFGSHFENGRHLKNMALTPFTTNLKTLGSTRNIYLFKPVVSGRFGRLHNRSIIIISYYYYYSYSPFFPWTVNLSTADVRNYWTEFHATWWSYRYMFLVDPKVFRFVRYDYNLTIMESPKSATDNRFKK